MKKILSLMALLMVAFTTAWAATEKSGNQGSSNVTIVGTSYTLDGNYVAGKGGVQQGDMPDKGVKLRSNKGPIVFTVNAGYEITGFRFYGCGNTSTAVTIVSATVDDGENLLTGDVVLTGKGGSTSGKIDLKNISAKDNITLTFAEGTEAQLVGTWEIDYVQNEVVVQEITAVTFNGAAISDTDLATLKTDKALTIDGSSINGLGAVAVTLSSGATTVKRTVADGNAVYKFTINSTDEYTITVTNVAKTYAAAAGRVVYFKAGDEEVTGANTSTVSANGITFTMANSEKTFQNGSGSVTLGETKYVPLKLSTGSGVDVTFPEGYVATKVTVYGWSANGDGSLFQIKETADGEKAIENTNNDVFYATNTADDIYPSVYEYTLDNWESFFFNAGGSASQPFVVMDFVLVEKEPTVEDIYTVAGNSDAIFGTVWDPANTANDMTKGEDGIYTKTYTGIALENGYVVQYKVVKNHSWDENWGKTKNGDNEEYTVWQGNGIYDVTFTFNPETEVVACDMVSKTVAAAALQQAIQQATAANQKLGSDELTQAITTASGVLANVETATATELKAAAETLAATATTIGKATLQQVVTLAESLGVDDAALNSALTTANEVLAKTNPTPAELTSALEGLLTAAKQPAKDLIENFLTLAAKFDSSINSDTNLLTKVTTLKGLLDNEDATIAQIKTAIEDVKDAATPYAEGAIVKLVGYANAINNETLTADVQAAQKAVTDNDFFAMVAAMRQLVADFPAAAQAYYNSISSLYTDEKIAGKTGADDLKDAIDALKNALASTDIVAIGEKTKELVQAVATFEAANPTVYTVVGNSLAIFGTEWDTTNTANDMVKGDDGIYTKTFKGIELTDGLVIKYKVVKDHAWDESWGFDENTDENNATYEVWEGDGKYNITFKFNPLAALDDAGHKVGCTMTKVVPHTWDFTQWSDETFANLKADAAASSSVGWSDIEKKDDTEPTELSKDNCFWYVGGETHPTANGTAIAELAGLEFNTSYGTARSLAIAVNYPTALSTYEGPAYLWLGGKGKECFTIKNVVAGSLITMGVESHKTSDARGVQLLVNGTVLKDAEGNEVAVPKTYTEQTWKVDGEDGTLVDVVVKNTNGCHIYFIDAEVVVISSVDLMGSSNEWTEPIATFTVKDASTGYWSADDVIFAANDEFKVRVSYSDNSEKWLVPESNGNFLVNADQLDKELTLTDEGGLNNMYVANAAKLSFNMNPAFTTLVINGEFLTLTLNEEDDNTNILDEWNGKTADVTLTRTLQTGGWNTFSVPFDLNIPTDWLVKELESSELNGTTLTLKFKDAASIEAGKPYLVKLNANEVVENPTFTGVTVSNAVVPTQTGYVDFIPTLGKTTINALNANTVLFIGANNYVYNPTSLPSDMKGFRGYFLLTGANEARSFVLDFGDGETTGIIEIGTMKNVDNKAIFDLQGRRVNSAAQKGVYIVNGKKTVIK